MNELTEVQNSAKFLDQVQSDWYTSINLDILNMNHITNCVLGQI
jgi:hypothetical protein